MRRKDLEITLSANVEGFIDKKIQYEQYLTHSRVAANLIFRAHQLGDMENKTVIDLCAGTGILGIAASLMGASKVVSVEIDKDAIDIMKSNYETLDLKSEIIQHDVVTLDIDERFDTAILNPPFGINRAQTRYKDLDFVVKASELASVVYSLHDGSKTNEEKLPEIFTKKGLEITEIYKDDFPIPRSYQFHTKRNLRYQVLVIRSERA